jgi:hypothetical protein
MCPKMKGAVCSLVDISPHSLECVSVRDCFGGDWPTCGVYVSQFFFDRNDEFVR